MTRTALPLFGFLLASTALAPAAFAQTTVTGETSETQRTSDTGDLTIDTSATLTPTGTGIVVDSDNDATVNGTIDIEGRNDAVGIDIQGGNAGDVVLGGVIRVDEEFTPDDTDDDNIPDGPFAQGSGRTGILISGAAPFTGSVATTSGSSIVVEGNDSFAMRLLESAGLVGNVVANGAMNVTGTNSRGLSVEGSVDGNVTTGGAIAVRGLNANGVAIAGDVTGSYTNTGSIRNTGYRFETRPSLGSRERLGEEDFLQGGSAVLVNGNVDGGLFFREVREVRLENGEPVLDANGNEIIDVTARSSVTQNGSAPAILLDGDGTPISIGVVAPVSGDDTDFQYAFINQGDMVANGVYDDVNATVFEAREVTLEGGLSNLGNMTAFTNRSGDDGTEDADGFTGTARVIVLGDQAIADTINNSGLITATVVEAADSIFADRENVIAARELSAIAIDIEATAETAALTNSGSITALLTGRDGEAVVIRDASGTLSTITNTGSISALGTTSDTGSGVQPDFNLVALDLRANTVGVTLTQSRAEGGGFPRIDGDILLGSGDDLVRSESGSILGDIDFGGGDDRFELDDSVFIGRLTNADGGLSITVADSSLSLFGGAPIEVSDATFDSESTFRPSIDVAAGTASTLVASGDVTFEDGSRVLPFFESFDGQGLSRFAIAQGDSVTVEGGLDTLGEGFAPFLFDTEYSLDSDSNTLFVDLRVRGADALGLDAAQSGALPAALAALGLNDELAGALINITDGDEFNTAYNQLLPEIAGAARQFVLANVDGAVGAVGSHLDNARRSQEQPGGAWFQQFGYFADRDRSGLSEQYRGSGFGFTGGIDTALGPFHAVGLNLGFASTEIEDTIGADDPLDITTLQAGAYAGLDFGGLGIEVYGGGGYNSFDSNRNIVIGDFLESASGDWDGYHYNGTLRAGYDIPIGSRFFARPTVSLDYLSLTEDAYTEDGADGIALALRKRTAESGAVTAMLNFGAEFQGERTWVRPAVRVGYRQDFAGDILTQGVFRGTDTPFAIDGNPFPEEGLLVGFSVGAGSAYSSLSFDLDSDIRDGFVRHTGRIVVRLLF